MPALPWFRMYIEFATDPDIQSLAFEDQRHYVMVLCLKGMGTLDKEYPSEDRRSAVIRRALGLDTATAAEARRRLMEAGLIDDEWQPHGWDKRQYESDSSTGRVQRHRDKKRFSNVSETPPETEADTDTEKPPLPPGLEPAVWERWVQYRKQIRKPIKPASMLAAQQKLAGFGADQAAVVEQSIANGWQGLFALKESGNGAGKSSGKPSAVERAQRATGGARF